MDLTIARPSAETCLKRSSWSTMRGDGKANMLVADATEELDLCLKSMVSFS